MWFAGKLGNWKLATYELDFLASRLNEATSRAPVGVSAEDTARRIASVRDAIDMRDLPAFTKAYSELTNACNACHRAAGHGFISVQVPAISPFTDQDFADQVAEGRKLAYTVCGVCHVVPDKPNAPLAMSFSARASSIWRAGPLSPRQPCASCWGPNTAASDRPRPCPTRG